MARLVRTHRGWKAYVIGVPVAVLVLAVLARMLYSLLLPLVAPALTLLALLGLVAFVLAARRW